MSVYPYTVADIGPPLDDEAYQESIVKAHAEADRYSIEVASRYGLVTNKYVAELFYEGLEVGDPLILSRLPGVDEVYQDDIDIPTFVATVRSRVLATVKQTLGKDTP